MIGCGLPEAQQLATNFSPTKMAEGAVTKLTMRGAAANGRRKQEERHNWDVCVLDTEYDYGTAHFEHEFCISVAAHVHVHTGAMM